MNTALRSNILARFANWEGSAFTQQHELVRFQQRVPSVGGQDGNGRVCKTLVLKSNAFDSRTDLQKRRTFVKTLEPKPLSKQEITSQKNDDPHDCSIHWLGVNLMRTSCIKPSLPLH
jgi:hypothetical protein